MFNSTLEKRHISHSENQEELLKTGKFCDIRKWKEQQDLNDTSPPS